MRFIIFYDPTTGDIIRLVQSETADPAKYGNEPHIIVTHGAIADPSLYRVISGDIVLK